jgi:threonyl-tRNA synthetase
VTLPDGKQLDGIAFETTPLQIAEQISSGLARAVLVAQVNDKVWDLTRPLEADCQLALLKFENDDAAKHVFWHSSAHILGQALEIAFAGQLCIGPPLDNGGFYYDIATAQPIHADDFDRVQKIVASIVKDNQPFERMVLTKAEALELFAANKYKLEIISKKIGDAETTTAYRCGPLIDLCRGPHISTTKKVEAFKLTKNSSAYWLGNAANDSLQRVYGISFPSKKLLKEWEDFQEKAAKRDHRVIGRQQDLFFFDPLSPGSAFWLPHGTRIYTKLIAFMRDQYHKRGFTEVITPNIYNHELWRISGHLENYAENIFSFKTREGEDYALKPMNCFRESDQQILTNRGFRFLDEVEALVERDAAGRVVDWRGLTVANYDAAAQRVVYQQPRALVVKPAGADRFVEFKSANGVHIVATEGHDMFVALRDGAFKKVSAAALLDMAASGSLPVSFVLAPTGHVAVHRFDLVASDAEATSPSSMVVRRVPSDGSRAWCFDMANGFVVVRQAHRVAAAKRSPGTEWVVLSSSRATVQGNCPGHCLMFKSTVRSYRELPLRLADFGVLHRNEITGALGGLTRVRRFQQDDAHIFCMPSQVQAEVAGAIEFIEAVYGLFNFKFDIALSTRPANFIGEVAVWDKAEEALKTVLNDYTKRSGKPWTLNPGDGAFYGPKLDIHVKDALNRAHQCATIQLDFQLPLRFELKYVAADTSEGSALPPPVIIHRAIFGSLERFTGILMEHTGGRWPLWLSPRQVCVVPVAQKHEPYAEQVRQRLHAEGLYVDVHGGEKTMNKRIAEASKQQYNYIVVVGDKEAETDSVNVRPRPKREQDHVPTVAKSVAQFLDELKAEVREFRVPADQDWINEDDNAPSSAALPSGKSSAVVPAASGDGMDY